MVESWLKKGFMGNVIIHTTATIIYADVFRCVTAVHRILNEVFVPFSPAYSVYVNNHL